MKVKLLYSSYLSSLEGDINAWLTNHKGLRVIDIKYAVDHDCGMYRYSAMIIYEAV